MPVQVVSSPGQKNTITVPKTGANSQQSPKAGVGWFDGLLATIADFYPEELLYNATMGGMSPDQIERQAKAHESDMLHAGADAVTAKASGNKVREDAKRDAVNPGSWVDSLVPDFRGGGIAGTGLSGTDVLIVGGALVAGYFVIKMVR